MFKINNNYYIVIHHLLYSIHKFIIIVYFISILYFRIVMHNIKHLTCFTTLQVIFYQDLLYVSSYKPTTLWLVLISNNCTWIIII